MISMQSREGLGLAFAEASKEFVLAKKVPKKKKKKKK